MKYYGNQIRKTSITTEIYLPNLFGRIGHRKVIRNVYRIDGPQGKPPGQWPIITTIKEAREYIREQREIS